MSNQGYLSDEPILIQQYLNELSDLRRVSGTVRESVVREAFKTLLKNWGRSHDLIFVPEHEHTTPTKSRVSVDGALLHALRVPVGYWEAKDEEDDLDEEIERNSAKAIRRTTSSLKTPALLSWCRIVRRSCAAASTNRSISKSY
jgi:hypothetical protein